ncbi:MAG: cell division protein ZapA [Acidovorax sp.]|nr:MAG: cell division protein ZapA [Acidovorax sp.]
MKQIEVQILQQSYLLTCPEGHESRLLDAVERVDTAMTRIRDAGKVRARERIAVLAALNLAFEIADREAADLAAASTRPAVDTATAQPAATAAATTSASSSAPLPAADDQRLQSLVQQLDHVLGEDGRLL